MIISIKSTMDNKLSVSVLSVQMCREAALAIEAVMSQETFTLTPQVSLCLNLFSVILSIADPALPRLER